MDKHKLYITWDEFERHANALCNRLKHTAEYKRGDFKGILTVTRGGLCPTAIMARELNIRHIDTVCIVSYSHDHEQGDMQTIKSPDIKDGGAGWLVVDDLVDSGDTFDMLRKMLPDAFFVTVYAKPDGRDKTDLCMIEIPQDTWIVLPWEEQD